MQLKDRLKTLFESDKIKHFIVGFLLPLILYKFTPIEHALVLCTIVFVSKEIIDIYKPNPTGFDWLDILADYLGLLVWFLLFYVFKITIL